MTTNEALTFLASELSALQALADAASSIQAERDLLRQQLTAAQQATQQPDAMQLQRIADLEAQLSARTGERDEALSQLAALNAAIDAAQGAV